VRPSFGRDAARARCIQVPRDVERRRPMHADLGAATEPATWRSLSPNAQN
jgi:hypothetical protein